jgi:hypothetical protein
VWGRLIWVSSSWPWVPSEQLLNFLWIAWIAVVPIACTILVWSTEQRAGNADSPFNRKRKNTVLLTGASAVLFNIVAGMYLNTSIILALAGV